jgi:hypothetical protein
MKSLKTITLLTAIFALQFVVTAPAGAQQAHADKTLAAAATANAKPVTWDTFVRAESDKYFKSYAAAGALDRKSVV